MSFDPYRKWLGIPNNRRPPNLLRAFGTLKVGGLDESSTFIGVIDELYFFDAALSAEQVQLVLHN